jgi:cytochrome c peroxidase
MLKRLFLLAFLVGALFAFTAHWARPARTSSNPERDRAAMILLGQRLFKDERFSTPKGDLPASCNHCHMLNEDPQGLRAFNDFFNRSWVSFRFQDKQRLALRNSPTIMDAAEMPRLHYDGEFASLEDLVKGTLSGRTLGWLPGEQAEAFDQARAVVLNDQTTAAENSYRSQFKKAFGIELDNLNRDETVNLIAQAVAEYCRTLQSRKDSAYDKFIALNRLDVAPTAGEDNQVFAQKLLAKISALEAKGALTLTKEFDQAALKGLKVFFRTDNGNCGVCHAPPSFSDQAFHNLGISQLEYDLRHGKGQFAALAIPRAAEAVRPSAQFRETPLEENPGQVDLGYWNFVDLKSSPQRRPAETEDQFLQRMTATFKTPTLRNLRYTQPYFHNGTLYTLEEVLSTMMKLSEMARSGEVRAADEELSKIKISDRDIAPLTAFLNSLNVNLRQYTTPSRTLPESQKVIKGRTSITKRHR